MAVSRRVLVTRPQPEADATARRLSAMGLHPVVLPLTRIEPVAPDALPDAGEVDAVTVTSVNALRHAPPALLSSLRHKPLFAVGDTTAAAACGAGFADVQAAAGTARDLAVLIGTRLRADARILHIAGVERTAGFAEALEGRGFGVRVVEVYRADAIAYADDALERLAEAGTFAQALLFSRRAALLLVALAAQGPMREALAGATFCCISQGVAAALAPLSPAEIRVAQEPDEEGILRLLRR